jgi:hypothetical protein
MDRIPLAFYVDAQQGEFRLYCYAALEQNNGEPCMWMWPILSEDPGERWYLVENAINPRSTAAHWSGIPAHQILVTTGGKSMSTVDPSPVPGMPGGDAGAGPPHVPAVTLPVLVCLPTVPDSPPADRTALAAMIGLVVIGRGPATARYRVGGRYAGLLHHLPDLDASDAIVIHSEPDQVPPACDGGTLGWLAPPATHTPDGDLLRVVTPDGRWHGPLPWEPDSVEEIRAADPPPVTRLRRMRWWTVVVMVEVTAPLRPGDARVPPWEWPS